MSRSDSNNQPFVAPQEGRLEPTGGQAELPPDDYDATRSATWGPLATPLNARPIGEASLPASGSLDLTTGRYSQDGGAATTDTSGGNAGGDSEAALDPGSKWAQMLKQLNVDTGQVVETDEHGKPLPPRDAGDVKRIVIREGHHDGDPPANFIIDKDGKIHENVDPSKSRGAGDDALIVEVDYQDGAKAATQAQRNAAEGMIAALKEQYAGAHIDPVIPDDLIAAANAADPPPIPVNKYSGGGSGFASPTGGFSGGGFSGAGGDIPRVAPHVGTDGHLTPTIPQNSPLFKALDMSKLPDRMVAATGSLETGGNFASINKNDNGQGWSVGIRQWNQKAGEMPSLIQAMYDRDPQKFQADFGQFAQKLIGPDGKVNASFIRGTDFNSLGPQFKGDMEKALGDFQDVQIALAREWAQSGIDMAKKYGFKSELAMAEVADAINQYGYAGAESRLKRLPAGGDEQSRIEQFDAALGRQRGNRLAQLEKNFSADKTAVA